MEVHLAAHPAGQERRLPAIFAIADDRMADRRHVRAQLVRAAGQWLQLHPGGAIAGAFDHAVSAARGLAVLLVDVHLFAAGARLLAERQIDDAVVDRRHIDDQRPIDLARGAARKALGEEGGGARGARQQQRTRCILVQPVDQLGPPLRLELKRVEQAIDMVVCLGAALRRKSGGLIDDDRLLVAVNHHRLHIIDLIVAQRRALTLRPRRLFLRWFQRGHADRLPSGQAIARRRAIAIDTQLAGARPFGDDRIAGVGQMTLEPAVEPDSVVIFADGELADVAGRRSMGHGGPR